MAVFAGPKIIQENLQIYMDFSNEKCYPRTGSNFFNLIDSSRNLGYIKNNVQFINNNQGILKTNGAQPGGTNAVGDRIDINTSASGIDRFSKENNFSIFFTNKWISGTGRIFSTGSAGSGNTDNCIWQFYLTGSSFFWWNTSGGGLDAITVIFTRPQGVWQHIGLTYEHNSSGSNIARVYIDGVLVGSTSRNNSNHSAVDRRGQTNLQWTLGGGYSSSCANTNTVNEFGNFMVYNKTLNPTEVKQNFEALRGRFGI